MAHLDLRVQRVNQVSPAVLVHLEPEVHLVLLDQWVFRDRQDHKGRKVILVPLEHQDPLDLLGL